METMIGVLAAAVLLALLVTRNTGNKLTGLNMYVGGEEVDR
ncbi:MAG: hypothetical protein UU65_C0002G0173 [candidate division CPR2 bacterium GW2011_GWC1_41_48]|uniref:Uncharacterized protein n=1 Tax=candidate division CPR2 bacterium GW2011_GWC1_41_48 TaxID=1618344 RepID=A0A0G0W8T1_UNCC2|nr:MAG: hypothetical protein UT47_C0002G0131 [candidate division CPR2 bacterium GW2011_GWC2_39_35]KKR27684.1 MAG: hypothetical protein UT60_C0040G0006 [candidate division CPR2 bacterium GW2011_GWD2_39_7]KKS09395.1 MAG: hypothetical protein UU65_C0002G0173 [candidate division CPR2 bacterium GW2011_GWC1_41_48]